MRLTHTSGRREPGHRSGSLLRQSSLISLAAGGGVLAGLLLDIVIAASFGAGPATDAFFVAVRVPLGLGAVVTAAANQALVPAFSTSLFTRTEAATWRLVSILVTAILVGGAVIVALTALLALPLMRLTAPGLPQTEVQVAASLAPVAFAMVPLITLAEVLRAMLNARYSFVPPAAMNIVMNALAAGIVLGLAHHNIHVVAWAFVAGAAAQAVFIFAFALRRGFRYRPSLRVTDHDVVATGRLCLRPIVAAGTNPVARIWEQLIASFLPLGSITILSYGYRLISAIGGTVFFRSVMVTLLPRLTEASARQDSDEVVRITGQGLRLMLTLSIPLTALMAVLSRPAVRVVFQRGQFSRHDATLLGAVLAVYAASLIGSAMQRALLAPFFARLDTRTPLRNTLYGVAANLVLLPLIVFPLGPRSANAVVGVAVAYALAQYVNVAHAWYRARSSLGAPWRGATGHALRLAIASGSGAAVMLVLTPRFRLDQPQHPWSLLLGTAAVAAAGLLTITWVLAALNASSLLEKWKMARRQRSIGTTPQAL